MTRNRYRLSREDLLKYAAFGVSQLLGFNAGNPYLSEEQEDEWEQAAREIKRRLKILETTNVNKDAKGTLP